MCNIGRVIGSGQPDGTGVQDGVRIPGPGLDRRVASLSRHLMGSEIGGQVSGIRPGLAGVGPVRVDRCECLARRRLVARYHAGHGLVPDDYDAGQRGRPARVGSQQGGFGSRGVQYPAVQHAVEPKIGWERLGTGHRGAGAAALAWRPAARRQAVAGVTGASAGTRAT